MGSVIRFIKRLAGWALLALLIYQLWFFAHILWWQRNDPKETRFMAIRLHELQQNNAQAELRHQWVDYEQISIHLKRAVVAAEDAKFMQHSGFDWQGIQNALKKNRQRGKRAAGGSTISQQLAKNLFLSPSKSYLRKAQEVVITLMLESCWSKQRILEVYLNIVEWGNGTFGAEAAAQKHFRTKARYINAEQAAYMAVLLPNPRRFERQLPNYAARYAKAVRSRMQSTHVP